MSKDIDNIEKRIDKIDEQPVSISKKLDTLSYRPNRREKHDSKRIKKYISFDPEQYKWIEENMKDWKFASVTHAVEWGLFVLKEKLDQEN